MNSVPVSASANTYLAVHDGEYVLAGGRSGPAPIDGAMYGLLPLLEREPAEVIAAIAALGGAAFPYSQLLETALQSNSGYWQERAVPWLIALNPAPEGSLAAAGHQALEMRRASQESRHAIRRWLRGKPPAGRDEQPTV